MFYCLGCEPNGNQVVSGPVPSPAWCPEHSPAAGDCPDYPALAGDAHYLDCSRKAPTATATVGHFRRIRRKCPFWRCLAEIAWRVSPVDARNPTRAAAPARFLGNAAQGKPASRPGALSGPSAHPEPVDSRRRLLQGGSKIEGMETTTSLLNA